MGTTKRCLNRALDPRWRDWWIKSIRTNKRRQGQQTAPNQISPLRVLPRSLTQHMLCPRLLDVCCFFFSAPVLVPRGSFLSADRGKPAKSPSRAGATTRPNQRYTSKLKFLRHLTWAPAETSQTASEAMRSEGRLAPLGRNARLVICDFIAELLSEQRGCWEADSHKGRRAKAVNRTLDRLASGPPRLCWIIILWAEIRPPRLSVSKT